MCTINGNISERRCECAQCTDRTTSVSDGRDTLDVPSYTGRNFVVGETQHCNHDEDHIGEVVVDNWEPNDRIYGNICAVWCFGVSLWICVLGGV